MSNAEPSTVTSMLSRHAGAVVPFPGEAAPRVTRMDRAYVCLGCGAPMIEIGCKIRCRACGYFEDCGGGLTPPPVDAKGA